MAPHGAAVDVASGCFDNYLAGNDDGSSDEVDIGFPIDLGGSTYSMLYVNNNGNVTFDGPSSDYTPFDFSTADEPIIAPFYADVDTRDPGSGLVYWGSTTFGGHPALCVTWGDANGTGVGYYDEHSDLLDMFQLLIVDRSDRSDGAFDIVFNYDQIQWEAGDVSAFSDDNGYGGLCSLDCVPPVAGYSGGSADSSYDIPGSLEAGAFLDGGPASLSTASNVGVAGRFVFSIGSAPACTSASPLRVGALTISGCWSRSGSTYETASSVTVNGITLQNGGTTTVDTSAGTVDVSGTPQWLVGGIEIAHEPFAWPVRGTLTVSAGGSLKGLALQGSLSIAFSAANGGAATITAYVGLPSSLGGVSGQTTLVASRNGGFSLSNVKIAVAEVRLGRVDLKNVQLTYQRTDSGDRWAGAGTLVLPGVPPDAPTVTLAASILDGSLESASADVDNLNKPIGGPVFLQSVHVGVVIDPFSFSGTVRLTAGPQPFGVAAISLDGSMSYWSQTWTFSGDLAVFGRQILNGTLHLRPSGEADINGSLNMSIGPVGVSATVDGFVTTTAFDLQGTGAVSLLGHSLSGTVLVSSKGVAACGHLVFVSLGFGYTWGGAVDLMGNSCDVGPWRVPRGGVSVVSGTALPRGAHVHAPIVAAGVPFELFSAAGTNATPDIIVRGPSSQTYDSRDGAFVNTADEFICHDDDNHTVYLAVPNPAAGTWTITAAPGSVRLLKVQQSDGRAPAVVAGHVSASTNGRYKLSYSIDRVPGQSVDFYESTTQSADGALKIATGKTSPGVLTYSPDPLEASDRYIIAVVNQDGLPRDQVVVASYTFTPAATLGEPEQIASSRTATGLTVKWKGPRDAAGWLEHVTASDGRDQMVTLAAGARSLFVSAPRSTDITVTLAALDRYGQEGAETEIDSPGS